MWPLSILTVFAIAVTAAKISRSWLLDRMFEEIARKDGISQMEAQANLRRASSSVFDVAIDWQFINGLPQTHSVKFYRAVYWISRGLLVLSFVSAFAWLRFESAGHG